MRAALFAASVILLLAGCVNRLAEREAFLSTLVGISEADLVRSLGVPNRTTVLARRLTRRSVLVSIRQWPVCKTP